MIEFVLKASIALLIFYTFYIAFLAKERMFGFNRFYLIFALSFSMLVPILPFPVSPPFEKNILVINSNVPISSLGIFGQSEIKSEIIHQTPDPSPVETAGKTITPAIPGINWISVVLGVYFLGLSLAFSRFIFRIGKIIQTIRANPTFQKGDITYVLLPHQTLPYTFLHYLFVEQQAFEEGSIEKEILHHESTHIRQKHSWDVLFVELLKTVFWINPLLILYKKTIQLNHEFLADEAVNTEFRDKGNYQLLLFKKIQRNRIPLSISSPFNASMTKRRIIMMGKSSSLFKANLYKFFSVVLTVMSLFFLSSNKPYYSVKPYPGAENDFEQLLAQGFIDGNPYQIDLAQIDLPALRKAYLAMDEEAKNKATEFPFFDEVTFEELKELQKAYPKVKTRIFFHSPPERKQIPNDVYLEWKNTKNIDLTIDEVEKDKNELTNHLPSDFVLFTVRETEEKKWFKKPTYQISLYTDDYYVEKHLKESKKIFEIRSEYPKAIGVRVFYPQKFMKSDDQKLSDLNSEKYKASIFYQLRTLDTALIESGYYKPTNIHAPESFGIAVFTEGKPTIYTNLPMIN